MRESAKWPENKEFRIYEPMNRITLSVILRTIFGAKGAELEELRESSNRRFSVRRHRVGPPLV